VNRSPVMENTCPNHNDTKLRCRNRERLVLLNGACSRG